jgi:hypothetical protein
LLCFFLMPLLCPKAVGAHGRPTHSGRLQEGRNLKKRLQIKLDKRPPLLLTRQSTDIRQQQAGTVTDYYALCIDSFSGNNYYECMYSRKFRPRTEGRKK